MIECSKYCLIKARNESVECFEDSFLTTAMDIVDAEAKIKELRSSRFEYCTVILNSKNGEPKLGITNPEAFKLNLDQEARQLAIIAHTQAFFNKVNPIFQAISESMPNLKVPTLKGLEEYRIALNNEVMAINNHLRTELGSRMQSYGSRRLSVDEVENDPAWQATKESGRKQIENLHNNIKLCDGYIEKLNELIGG